MHQYSANDRNLLTIGHFAVSHCCPISTSILADCCTHIW